MGPILCVGEVLWDCLPGGLFLGGAPMNVAYHLHALGRRALPVSALGDDQLGAETRRRLGQWGIDDRFIATVAADTGTVLVELDERGSPSYEIVADVAWDRIPSTQDLLAHAEGAAALVFGSLAQRGDDNQETLQRLRYACEGLTVFDINLRAPHDDLDLVRELGEGVDLLKLNDDELARFHDGPLADGAAALQQELGCKRVLVTAGADGAGLLEGDDWDWAPTPPVKVRDTVGAGDSFTAAFLDGLLAGKTGPDCLERAGRLASFVAGSQGATPSHDRAPSLD